MSTVKLDDQDEPLAWLVEFKIDPRGETWVDVHASEVRARDQAKFRNGTVTPLYARATPADHISQARDAVIEKKRYVVQKTLGSSTARVIDTHSGMTIKAYDSFKRDGWKRADKHAETLNARALTTPSDERRCDD